MTLELDGRVVARYLRLSLMERNYLHLAQVEVMARRQDAEHFHAMNIVAARSDGLGARLNAIFNALLVSELTGADFRFNWTAFETTEYLAMEDAQKIFASEFIHKHWIDKAEIVQLKLLRWRYGSLDKLRAYSLEQIAAGDCLVPWYSFFPLISSNEPAREDMRQAALKRLEFSPAIVDLKKRIDTLPIDSAAFCIHIRAGDNIYGDYSNSPDWYDKLIPTAIIPAVIGKMRTGEGNGYLIGQERKTMERLSSRLGVVCAHEIIGSIPGGPLEAAFADMFFMANVSTIVANRSGFANFPMQLSGGKLLSLRDLLTPEEIVDGVFRELADHADDHSPEQVGYGYYYAHDCAMPFLPAQDRLKFSALANKSCPDHLMFALIHALGLWNVQKPDEADRVLDDWRMIYRARYGEGKELAALLRTLGMINIRTRVFSYRKFIEDITRDVDAATPLIHGVVSFLRNPNPLSQDSAEKLKAAFELP
jgi:hypothetical protein